MIRVSALYASQDGAHFDYEYYANKHFPIVMDLMKPFGAIRYEVEKGLAMADGSRPDFIAVGTMFFESLERLQAGLSENGGQITPDVKNYTNLKPRLQIGEILT